MMKICRVRSHLVAAIVLLQGLMLGCALDPDEAIERVEQEMLCREVGDLTGLFDGSGWDASASNFASDSPPPIEFVNCDAQPIDEVMRRIRDIADEAREECGTKQVRITCGSCGCSQAQGYAKRNRITVCTDPEESLPPDYLTELLTHELTHVRQYCEVPLQNPFTLCEEATCREHEAYDADGLCGDAVDHGWDSEDACLCFWSCESVREASGGWCDLLNDCETKCERFAGNGQCSGGHFHPFGASSEVETDAPVRDSGRIEPVDDSQQFE